MWKKQRCQMALAICCSLHATIIRLTAEKERKNYVKWNCNRVNNECRNKIPLDSIVIAFCTNDPINGTTGTGQRKKNERYEKGMKERNAEKVTLKGRASECHC